MHAARVNGFVYGDQPEWYTLHNFHLFVRVCLPPEDFSSLKIATQSLSVARLSVTEIDGLVAYQQTHCRMQTS